MRISVVCLASRSAGGLTILKDLYNFARKSGERHHWQFILSDQLLGNSAQNVDVVRTCPNYKGWRSRFWSELTSGRVAVKRFNPDVVLSLQNIDTPARGNHPLAVYLHQSLPFQTDYRPSFWDKNEWKLALRQYLLKFPILKAVRKSSVTFVQTQWMEKKIRATCGDSNVMAIGFNRSTSGHLHREDHVQENRFFYPASGSGYKNHRTLHGALRVLNDRGMSLSGKVSVTLSTDQLVRVVGEMPPEELSWYNRLGWLASEEVFEQYSDAILVFPSLVESLGLPLYEGQDAGIWIVAADTLYAREALENYPLVKWFQPTDPLSMADAMQDAWAASRSRRVRIVGSSEPRSSWAILLEELEDLFGKTEV